MERYATNIFFSQISFVIQYNLKATPISVQTCPGLDQYAIKKFAEAFEAIPRALGENSGIKANELISKLYAVHQEGNKNVGFDIEVRLGTNSP